MTFVHPLLLGGLLLVGVPILLHLIMQQKPRHLAFPAFRFLLQKHRTNQRTLRLRHLLLLALRVLLIAAICLALARPKLFSDRFNFSGNQPVAAVFLFDTSPSMEYTVAGRTRLDDGKRRALELLDELPPGSRVAVFDSAEAGGEWAGNVAAARDLVTNLTLRPANSPVTRQIDQAYRLFTRLEQETDAKELPPRLLYVLSDRTPECWDGSSAKSIKQPDGVHSVFIDVGVEQPADLAIVNVELPKQTDQQIARQVFAPDEKITLNATVRATGADYNTEILCQVPGRDGAVVLKRPVVLKAGQSEIIPFEIDGKTLQPGFRQLELKLATNDALPFDNTRYLTLEIRGGRRVLLIVDERDDSARDAAILKPTLELLRRWRCEVMDTGKANDFYPEDLVKNYQVICLVDVAQPGASLWDRLKAYVEMGGGLAVFPGDVKKEAYQGDRNALQLMPGLLDQIVTAPAEPGVTWGKMQQHPLMAPFSAWRKLGGVDFTDPAREPHAFHYWRVNAPDTSSALAFYADDKQSPVLLEKTVGKGRVLLLTTPFGNRSDSKKRLWTNYWETSFAMVLADKTVGYLAGDAEAVNYNFTSGQTVTVELPSTSRLPVYSLIGPGLSGAEGSVPRVEGQSDLQLRQAVTPGNYALSAGEGPPLKSFSVNAKPEECELERVPVEQIESLLGSGAVVPVGHSDDLRDALQGRWQQPVELLPWLMIAVLLALALENLLANKSRQFQPHNDAAKPEDAKRLLAEPAERVLAKTLGGGLRGAAAGGVVALLPGVIIGFIRTSYGQGFSGALQTVVVFAVGWGLVGAMIGLLMGAIAGVVEASRTGIIGGVIRGAAVGAVLGLLILPSAWFHDDAAALRAGCVIGLMVGAVEGAVIGLRNWYRPRDSIETT